MRVLVIVHLASRDRGDRLRRSSAEPACARCSPHHCRRAGARRACGFPQMVWRDIRLPVPFCGCAAGRDCRRRRNAGVWVVGAAGSARRTQRPDDRSPDLQLDRCEQGPPMDRANETSDEDRRYMDYLGRSSGGRCLPSRNTAQGPMAPTRRPWLPDRGRSRRDPGPPAHDPPARATSQSAGCLPLRWMRSRDRLLRDDRLPPVARAQRAASHRNLGAQLLLQRSPSMRPIAERTWACTGSPTFSAACCTAPCYWLCSSRPSGSAPAQRCRVSRLPARGNPPCGPKSGGTNVRALSRHESHSPHAPSGWSVNNRADHP